MGNEGTDCEVTDVPNRAPIHKIRVFRWESQLISGLGIRLLDVEDIVREALFTKDYVDFEFDTSKETAVGMYGARSAEYIIELGFIVMNLECVIDAQDTNNSTLKR